MTATGSQRDVIVHVHHVFWPFSYPRQCVEGGRYWNEAFYVRLLLLMNETFAIEFWCDYLNRKHRQQLLAMLPRVSRGIDDHRSGTASGCARTERRSLWG